MDPGADCRDDQLARSPACETSVVQVASPAELDVLQAVQVPDPHPRPERIVLLRVRPIPLLSLLLDHRAEFHHDLFRHERREPRHESMREASQSPNEAHEPEPKGIDHMLAVRGVLFAKSP
eukprot:scaffold8_cov249-Pinguiococcus_pyrenoidosus.AAC.6